MPLGAGGEDLQYLRAGLLDEIQVHITPMFLGVGVRLFDDLGTAQIELKPTRVVDSPVVTHVEALGSNWTFLDLTPLGRQEEWEDSPARVPQGPPYEWWRRHDEYEGTA